MFKGGQDSSNRELLINNWYLGYYKWQFSSYFWRLIDSINICVPSNCQLLRESDLIGSSGL